MYRSSLLRLLILTMLFSGITRIYAQQDQVMDSISEQGKQLDSLAKRTRILDSLAFNIHLQAHVSYYSDIFELGENVPRFGTSLFRNVGNNTRVFARLEYGLNLSKETRFNNNANTPSDFVRDPLQEPDPFSSRLGYLGIAHETLGSIALGKQWGVYYDIGGYTDGFTVFGSSGVDVYAGSTDGGWKGTGRADVAVVYRNHIGKLHFGLQTQLFGSHTNYGASLTYRFNPRLSTGVAWNRASIPPEFQDLLQNVNTKSDNLIVGYQYVDKKLYSGLTIAYIEDEYRIVDETTIISFPVVGTEFLNRYTLNPRIKVEAGFNAQWETKNNTYFNGDYRLLQFYAGMNYYFGELFSIYIQGRLDDSRFLPPVKSANVIIIGLSFDFIKGVG
ncbi:porin [Robertkochia flava]|uniref:porin n=1 Tax=Robertkochia flava TaxID=3447986 RepID=UPI001CC9AA9E|nr:porin [Robertkochia marina]